MNVTIINNDESIQLRFAAQYYLALCDEKLQRHKIAKMHLCDPGRKTDSPYFFATCHLFSAAIRVAAWLEIHDDLAKIRRNMKHLFTNSKITVIVRELLENDKYMAVAIRDTIAHRETTTDRKHPYYKKRIPVLRKITVENALAGLRGIRME